MRLRRDHCTVWDWPSNISLKLMRLTWPCLAGDLEIFKTLIPRHEASCAAKQTHKTPEMLNLELINRIKAEIRVKKGSRRSAYLKWSVFQLGPSVPLALIIWVRFTRTRTLTYYIVYTNTVYALFTTPASSIWRFNNAYILHILSAKTCWLSWSYLPRYSLCGAVLSNPY